MTASAQSAQPRARRRERRIIERPRLIKLLDETDARTILLLAPAGYGKTTLARQWAKTLTKCVWVSLGATHQDVAALALDLAHGISSFGDASSPISNIEQHLKARANPQRAARQLGDVVARSIALTGVQWLILDDYEQLEGAPPAEDLIAAIAESAATRIVVASRVRPQWATGRSVVYGDVREIGRDELAMTPGETAAVLTSHTNIERIIEQAEGWPAVVGLAASADTADVPTNALPAAMHRYLAEELFQRAPERLQQQLFTLALLGDSSQEALQSHFGSGADQLVSDASELGFGSGDHEFQLHPLLREFLLEKLIETPGAAKRVRQAVEAQLEAESWDRALELILRFELFDQMERALTLAFNPLARSGRFGTLSRVAEAARTTPSFPPPTVDLIAAEIALRDGNFELATDLAARVEPKLGPNHPLSSRAAAITGHAAYLLADFEAAEEAFERARSQAQDDRDETEALHGLALTNVFGERKGAKRAVAALAKRRNVSPIDLIRFKTADVALRRLGGSEDGLSKSLHLDAARRALAYADDPRARSSLSYTVAYAIAQRADYAEAKEWIDLCLEEAKRFGLEFAMPYAIWASGLIALGQRRYAAAERAIQAIEDLSSARDPHHALNARGLRARLLLQVGDSDEAYELVSHEPTIKLMPSWKGEYVALRAVALACQGHEQDALAAASIAERESIAIEVRELAQVARSIATLHRGPDEALGLVALATRSRIWDPVVCGVRSSIGLADLLASRPETRPAMADLYRRTRDVPLARRAGLRTRATASPDEVLSPRELEVLGLIARGYRNRDISEALFIAESTTKIHIRHIFEKLGVRTRSEAVARFKMFDV